MTRRSELFLKIPDAVRYILETLRQHGHEAYVVGGCVRDALLCREPKDWDVTTSALPAQVKELFPHTVDTGIRHGTVMVLKNGSGYEVTTYRIDGEYKDGRHPSCVTFTRSLEEDLKRRDFTINAFAYGEEGLIDLFDGLKDLHSGVIRCVGDPDCRFREDALRIMRAVRFSAQLGFRIDEETGRMIRQHTPRLSGISMERIREEWEKTLLSDHPQKLCLYADYGIAPFIVKPGSERCFLPEQDALFSEVQLQRDALSGGRYRILMMAAFFLGLTFEEADLALRNLRYDNKTRTQVARVLKYRDEPLAADRTAVRRSLSRMGQETWMDVLSLRDALQRTGKCEGEGEVLREVTQITREVLRSGEAYSIAQLAIDGKDLIRLGYPPGKKIGEMLEKILQKVIQSPTLNRRDVLCDSVFLEEVENDC